MAFVADQGVLGLASTFVPFFGRPAKTPRGAAVFALRFDAPVVFVVALRQPNGGTGSSVERIEAPQTGDRERDVDAIVARYTEHSREVGTRGVPSSISGSIVDGDGSRRTRRASCEIHGLTRDGR